jgi:hypothetical protein
MAKIKCPYCTKKFTSKDDYSHHVTVHVVEIIRKDRPGLLEMIEKVEGELPVKFLIKVDTEKISMAEAVGDNLIETIEESQGEQS